MILDKIIKIKKRNTFTIIGFSEIYSLLLIMSGIPFFTILIAGFSFLFYPIGISNFETWGLIAVVAFTCLFGFGFKIKITPTKLYFYTTSFFIPFLKLQENLQNVVVDESGRIRDAEKGTLLIKWDDDPWAEMGFSDWVSLKKGDKEFDIGTNNNYKELLATIKEGIEGMRKLQK